MLKKIKNLLNIGGETEGSPEDVYKQMVANVKAVANDYQFKEIFNYFERELGSVDRQLQRYSELSERELIRLLAHKEAILKYMNWIYNLLIA